MIEVYVGTNSPVRTKIFYDGDLIDADGTVVVHLYDITEDPLIEPHVDPLAIVQSFDSEKSEVDTGSYSFVLPRSLTQRARKFKAHWVYSADAISSEHVTYTDVILPYCDLSEAIEHLGLGTDPSDPNHKSYEELQSAEKWARKVIEHHTSQKFYKYGSTEIAYGSGGNILPLASKIISVRRVYESDILLVDTHDIVDNWAYTPIVSESGFGIRVDGNGHEAFHKNTRYRIDGVFGWESVPADVQDACIALMGDYFSKDKVWKAKYIKNIQTFDWKFEYSSDAYSGTGNLYADQLLAQYIVSGMVVMQEG